MKKFLEEYGFAILAAIVVILLIAMCTPVGHLIKSQVMGVVESFASRTEAKLATIEDDTVKVRLSQSEGSGKFTVIVESASVSDTFAVEFRVKDQNNNWSNWAAVDDLVDNTSKLHTKEYTIPLDVNDGNSVQAKAKDIGKDNEEYFESGIVIYKEQEVIINLISFTIKNTPYQAEEGMTWEEWVNSQYNINEYFLNDNYVCVAHFTGPVYKDSRSQHVGYSDVIQENVNYSYPSRASSEC